MAELELEGLHPDGEHLVLVGPDGHRYRLLIDEALRAAVRRDRARLEQLRSTTTLRPRDIQTRIRAGASVEVVAQEAELPLEYVRRYEGPVLAERTWVAEQARQVAVGREVDAPRLGDLVVDRLAARGVPPESLSWTAIRRTGEPWELVLRFRAADREREARWTVDLHSRAVHALDDEGRWLSETELGATSARRHLTTVRARSAALEDSLAAEVAPVAPVTVQEPGGSPDRTDELLDELRAARGVRHEVVLPEGEDVDDLWASPPPAHPPASAPGERVDAAVLPLPLGKGGDAPESGPEPGRRPPRARGKRQSIPSWDEIVFGAKPE